LVITREILQAEFIEESNATYMEEFKLRLGYEFTVTVKDSRYSVDYIDLVILDCDGGSTLLIVKGAQPTGVSSPFMILFPGLAILGIAIVLVILFVHFETSPEFAVLLLQSFMIPIYMRIRGAQALDSFNRGRIFEQVRMHPGSSFTNLKEGLGMGNGTLAYHLSVLQKLELVRSVKDGRERRYFLCGVNLQNKPDMWLGKTEAKVLEELLTNGPMSASNVASRLDISRQRVHYNMRLLLKRGLAVHERPLWRAAQNQASTHTHEG
jgi:predicted transcriptional regulator